MSRYKGSRACGRSCVREGVLFLSLLLLLFFSPPLLILTNLEVVRQSNAGVCHLGLFRVPAELFDVTDVRLGIREGVGGGVGVFFLFLLD